MKGKLPFSEATNTKILELEAMGDELKKLVGKMRVPTDKRTLEDEKKIVCKENLLLRRKRSGRNRYFSKLW